MRATLPGRCLAALSLPFFVVAGPAPSTWEELFQSAQLAQRAGDPWRARQVLLSALRIAGPFENVVTHYALGGADELLGRHSDARKQYEQGLAILLETEVPADLLHTWQARFHNGLGVLRLHAKDLNGAERHFRAALAESRQGDWQSGVDSANALNNLGTVLFRRGRHEEALTTLQKAVQLYDAQYFSTLLPRSYALANIALIASSLGRLSDADLASQTALDQVTSALGAQHPRRGGFLQIRAEVLRRLDRKQEARQLAREARDLPRDPAIGAFLDLSSSKN